MTTAAVGAPPLNADAVTLADWLELVAFFDLDGTARLDSIDGALKILEEDNEEDTGEADAKKDERRGSIEEEIEIRSCSLEDAYPYVLSEDGEELRLKSRGNRTGAAFYLSCLVISHFSHSPILERPPANQADVRKAQFQILSTLAVAGNLVGSAISFGWPRASGETIKEALTRFTEAAGTGLVRDPPGPEASKYAKDGGMDVIAWRPAVNNVPPPAMLVYGQAASGRNWSAKSAMDEIDQFHQGYFTDDPAVAAVGVTVVPFRLSKEDHAQWGRRHGHILDRLRTPKAALEAIALSEAGHSIDEVDRVRRLNLWLLRYRKEVRAA
jgi:hypothetical protein